MWLKDVRYRNYWIELFDFHDCELFDKSKDIHSRHSGNGAKGRDKEGNG